MDIFINIICVGFAAIPVICFDNLAQMTQYRGQASQSSTYDNNQWSADKAVDGHLQGDDQSSCSFTRDWTSTVAWWKFPLKETANVAYLEIHFRKGTVNRSIGFSTFVFDDPGFIPTSSSPNKVFTQAATPCPTPVLNVTVNRATRGIALFNTKETRINTSCEGYRYGHHYSTIEVCEVRVMGCPYGHFGENCLLCGQCQNGLCDVYNGSCIQGCSTHVMEPPLCVDCINGLYGNNCTQTCGKCQTGTYCDDVNGTCPAGCQDHWSGSNCDACRDGFYGPDCALSCGQCKLGTQCNKTTGFCWEGCQKNWNGIKCDVCGNGFYGTNCTKACGKCEKFRCHNVTGVCPNGCEKRWNGSRCDECEEGFFGSNCEDPCGQCLEVTCAQKSGHCLQGCQENSDGARCDVLSMTSEASTGTIVAGISATFVIFVGAAIAILFLRHRHKLKRQRNTNRSNTSTNSKRRSSHSKDNSDIRENSPVAPSNVRIPGVDGTVESGYYNLAHVGTEIGIGELNLCITAKSMGENNIFLTEYKELPQKDVKACCEAQKTENIVKNRFKYTLPYDHSRVHLNEKWNNSHNDYINANYIKGTNGVKRYIATQGPRENTVEDFWRLIWQEDVEYIVMLANLVETGKKKCAKYWPERGQPLRMGPCVILLSDEASYAFHTVRKFNVEREDLTLNRTITQFHYTAWPDHGTPDELGLIQFHRYVSTRYRPGPPLLIHCSAGVGRSGTYIGLDSLLIQGKEKGRINVFECVKQMRQDRMTMVQTAEQYVFLHRALHVGFQVKDTVISEHTLQEKVKALLNDSLPLNQQSLYNEYQFLETLKPVYKSEEKDVARKPENRGKNVDMEILPVSRFRPYLTTHVTGRNEYIKEAQYIKILFHDSFKHLSRSMVSPSKRFEHGESKKYRSRSKLIEITEKIIILVMSFTNPTAFIVTQNPLPETEVDFWRLCVDHGVKVVIVLVDEMQLRMDGEVDIFTAVRQIHTRRPEVITNLFLETLKPVYKSEEKDVARKPENRGKNVDMEILPVSRFRPYLTTHVTGRNEYINAVIVPSFTNPTAFIVTQNPLPETEVDFWRLCVDHGVKVVIVLVDEMQENKWLPAKGLAHECPPFIITARNKETYNYGITLESLQVSKDQIEKNLDVYQVPSRKEDALVKATELLLDREQNSILTSVITSKNGAGPAGIFCVLHNALQQLRMDGEVDIFTAVRQIQTRRPEVITNLEEYQQCYKLVTRLAFSEGIYANTATRDTALI